MIIALLLSLAVGVAAQDDCGLPENPALNNKERRLMKESLDGQLRDWKAIGATGRQPAITFESIDATHIVVSSAYELDGSLVVKNESDYDWARSAALWDVTHRLSDIFGMVSALGYDVVLKTTFATGRPQKLFAYDNATLRRIMALPSTAAVRLYAEAASIRRKAPYQFDSNIVCTGASYCDHLFTLNLRVDISPEGDEFPFPWIDLQVYCAGMLEGSDTRLAAAYDSSAVRIVVDWPGLPVPETFTFDFPVDRLRSNGTLVDVDSIGRMLASVVNSQCPVVLDSSLTLQSCEYDPSLQVIVENFSASELLVVTYEGREDASRDIILKVLGENYDTGVMLDALVAVGLGLEFRLRSRTSFRPATITFTHEDLRFFIENIMN